MRLSELGIHFQLPDLKGKRNVWIEGDGFRLCVHSFLDEKIGEITLTIWKDGKKYPKPVKKKTYTF